MALRLQNLVRSLEREPETPFSRQVRTYAENAQRQIGTLASLVNDLLDVSRIASGRFRVELEPADGTALTG